MTDRKGKPRKSQFGADREADKVLDKLPRIKPGWPNAAVYIDAAGRLMVQLANGLLTINERDLAYVHGDELYD